MFRHEEDDMDYIHLTDAEVSTVVFRQRELLLWMGGVAVKEGDDRIIRLANRKHGTFYEGTGWNPRVYIEDRANEEETEWYIENLMSDLKKSKTIPKRLLEP